MADFWIKIEKSTPDKPEIFEMSEILEIDPDAVLGKLIRVWCWADSNSENGHIKSVTSVLIDRLTMSPGFADAMKTVGWLSENDIPNFGRHLGESAKKRAKDAERKRKSRASSEKCHTKPVTESGLDKSRVDKSKEKTTTAIAPDVDFSVFNLPDDIVTEIKRIRIANKGGAIKTQRVANGLAKEINLAMASGISIDDILTEWETRKWKSFKSEWMQNKGASHGQERSSTVSRIEQATARRRAEIEAAGLTGGAVDAQAVGQAGPPVWPQTGEPVRSDTTGHMGSVYEGDYTRTDGQGS